MTAPILLCRTATTFARTGALDEDALARYLQRFVDAGIGVYLCSGGSGEGHALSREEIRRVYEIGIAVCRGKVPVNANPPEHYTARVTREHVLLAIDAGVDAVNIYGPAGWHGYRPTDAEFIAYHDEVLASIKCPIALAPNPTVGYMPKPALIAAICRKYSQVVAVNLKGASDAYFVELQELVGPGMPLYVELTGSLNALAMGAAGLLVAESNALPKTFRRYIDLYQSGKTEELGRVYADLKRFNNYVKPWGSSNPRWIKMLMKVFNLPGADGGLREPYRMPPAEELEKFAAGLLALGIPEIGEMARAAGK